MWKFKNRDLTHVITDAFLFQSDDLNAYISCKIWLFGQLFFVVGSGVEIIQVVVLFEASSYRTFTEIARLASLIIVSCFRIISFINVKMYTIVLNISIEREQI